jgi:hypothetical protein
MLEPVSTYRKAGWGKHARHSAEGDGRETVVTRLIFPSEVWQFLAIYERPYH